MVAQEEPCRGNHSTARRQSVFRVVLCRHKNTLLVSHYVSFATCIFKTLCVVLLQLIVHKVITNCDCNLAFVKNTRLQ